MEFADDLHQVAVAVKAAHPGRASMARESDAGPKGYVLLETGIVRIYNADMQVVQEYAAHAPYDTENIREHIARESIAGLLSGWQSDLDKNGGRPPKALCSCHN